MIIRCNAYKKRRAAKTLLFYVSFFSASYLMKILYENLFHVSSFLVLLLLENLGLILNDLFLLFYSFIFTPSRYFLLRGNKLCNNSSPPELLDFTRNTNQMESSCRKGKKREETLSLFHILKLRRTWSSWEWNYVTDVSHASDVH